MAIPMLKVSILILMMLYEMHCEGTIGKPKPWIILGMGLVNDDSGIID